MGKLYQFFRQLLSGPFSFKIFLINTILGTVLALFGVLFAIEHIRLAPAEPHYDLILIYVVFGLTLNLGLNLLMLKSLRGPINHLSDKVRAVRQGQRDVLAAPEHTGDRQLDQVADAFAEMQHAVDQTKHQIHDLSQQVVYAQEAERQKIARELHDEAAQTLTSVLLYLRLLEKTSNSDSLQRLQNLRKLITHALTEIRRLALELHPKVLDEWGLEGALIQRVDEINMDGSQTVTLEVVDHALDNLPKELEVTFYRVAQEALNNVTRHSHARCAHVIAKQEAKWLTLDIKDDGVGFNVNNLQTNQPRSLGLQSMRERLALVSGELTIESQPDKGTRLYARAPLPIRTTAGVQSEISKT